MLRFKKLFFGFLCCLPLSLGTTAMAASELQFQSTYPLNHTVHKSFLTPWVAEIKEKTGGNLIIHEFAQGSIVKPLETGPAMETGLIDMAIWGSSPNPKQYSHFMAAEIPFLSKADAYHTGQHGAKILWEMYKQLPEVKKSIDDTGELLLMWSTGSNAFFSLNSPILSPADLKGKRVLTLTPTQVEQIKAWGGTPVFVQATDVYVSLQRGMGEVLYTSVVYAVSLRIPEIAKYLTNFPSNLSPLTLSVNKDVYAELPEEQKKVLKDLSGEEASLEIGKVIDKDTADGLQVFRDAGIEVIDLTPEQITVFEKGLDSLINTTWVKNLQSYGIKGDAASAWIKKVTNLADTVPIP